MSILEIKHELTCSICLDLYTDAVRLTCFHAFCRKCISNVISTNRQPRCPECITQIAKPDIQILRSDFKLNSMVTALRKEPTCTAHRNVQHAAFVVCKRCRVNLCLESVKNHGQHELCDVKSYIDEYHKEISTKMPTVKQNLSNLKQYLADIKKSQVETKDLNERLKKQFLADLDSLRRELDQIKESCIVEMERVDKDSVKELQTKQTSLEKKIETVQKLLEHHENLQTDPANSIEFIKEKGHEFFSTFNYDEGMRCMRNVTDILNKCPNTTMKIKKFASRVTNFEQVYHSGSVFDKDILSRFVEGVRNVACLSLRIGYPTAASAPHSFANGFKNLLAIAVQTDITFPEAKRTKEYLADPSKFAVAAPTAAAPAAAAGGGKAAEKKE